MGLVTTLTKDNHIIGFKKDEKGNIDLDSIFVFGLSKANHSNISRVHIDGEYTFIRTDHLTPDKYDPEKNLLNIDQANNLINYLRSRYNLRELNEDL